MMDLIPLLKINNPILDYYGKIKSGEILACQKIHNVYSKLVQNLMTPRGNWIYDENKANHAIYFIENYCKHSKGKFGGKPVLLELWQKAFVAAAFGFVDKNTGFRKYTEVLLIVARKNGKSTLAAAIGLYLQIADGEAGAEVYSLATTRDQAKLIWIEAKRMVRKSPALTKRIKPLVAELVGRNGYDDTFFKPLGSDSDNLDGLNVHGALMDEIHAWKDMNLFDVVADAVSAREQPMLLLTTTAGTIREQVYDSKYEYASNVVNGLEGFEDERLLAVIYELDDRAEWTEIENAIKANPGLGTIKDKGKLAEKINRAKRNPSAVKNLLCKDFNIRETSSNAWLNYEDVNNENTFDIEKLRGSYAIGGCDLAATTDLTCATLLIMLPNSEEKYVLQMYFLPSELIEQRVAEDKIPYDKWVERGLLTLSEGHRVNFSDVTNWFKKMLTEYDIRPLWIYYDRALSGYWVEEMMLFGFNMEKAAQGALTFSQPMRSLEGDLKSNLVNYNNNPILKWCLCNTVALIDNNDNIRPIKGKNNRKRIDGMVSLLDAYVGLQERYNEYKSLIGG